MSWSNSSGAVFVNSFVTADFNPSYDAWLITSSLIRDVIETGRLENANWNLIPHFKSELMNYVYIDKVKLRFEHLKPTS